MFKLHRRLAQDTWVVGHFSLCLLLLSRDANYPWFLLVPRVADTREIHQLSSTEQHQLMDESSRLAEQLEQCFAADKINIAALGNVVPQLHVHHVVRYQDDPAWPDAIWGAVDPVTYTDEQRNACLARLNARQLRGFTCDLT